MKTLTFSGESALQVITEQNSDARPVCNLPLCGRPADWEVDMFGKPEYYCERHKPGVPERFMRKLNHQ